MDGSGTCLSGRGRRRAVLTVGNLAGRIAKAKNTLPMQKKGLGYLAVGARLKAAAFTAPTAL